MSSRVMSPDVPPNSSTTIARCAGPRWKSRSWLSSVLVSGTKAAGRTRSCQRAVAAASSPPRPMANGTRSFANTTPAMLSGVPSYTGRRECSLWRNASMTSSLGAAEVGLEGAAGGDEAVQALVDPRQQPEEQAERGEGAAREREGGRRELGCDTRQAARQGVAHNEQKGRRYRPAAQRFRPGPAPPPQGVARGHRAEHE